MEYHQDRFEDFSLMLFYKQKLIGLLPANRIDNELHSHQGLTYGGLLLPKSVRFEVVLKGFVALLKFLEAQQIESLYIKEMPSIYCKIPSEELEYFNFILKAQLLRRDTLSVIDVRHRLKFSSGRIEGINRGIKHNLKIVEDDSFEAFWKTILEVNLKDKHSARPVHSLEEIIQLKQKFPQNIKQFNVYKGEKLVAGATIFEASQVAHCQYISGDADKNQLGSLDFLHEHLINKVYSHKAYFDFGTSNENDGKNVNQGLQFWKEGFGARTVTQDFYKIAVKNYPLLESVLQ